MREKSYDNNNNNNSNKQNIYIYTGAPVVGTPILGTHYIVSCDAEVCGAERERVEQDDTGTYALSGLFRPAVFR